MISKDDFKQFQVKPGKKFSIKDHDPAWKFEGVGKADPKEQAKLFLETSLKELAEAQELLYADDRYSILMILQAMDAAGKDGTIKHVMSGVNPTGCQVYSFKKPSEEELDHDFLWRCVKCLPERGRIGIFNRSYYEEVLVVKVHPEILDHQKLPPGKRGKSFWQARYDDINAFEQHLVRNGTTLVKVFLNISKDEQKRRFIERLDTAAKNWKFSSADLKERESWDQYQEAYEDCLAATSTEATPWHVVPADHKWVTRAVVAELLTSTVRSLDLRYPEVDAAERERLAQAKRKLLAE